MRAVEGHPDFARLEARLFELIEETKSTSPAGLFASLLVVVPTGRLRSYLQALLGRRFGALLNVRILDHISLAREAAAGSDIDLPRSIPRRAREALLESCIGSGFRRLAEYIRSCPGALPALLATMDDLRDAGIDPRATLEIDRLTPRGREVLNLCGVYCEKLAGLASAGHEDSAHAKHATAFTGERADRAGVMSAAARHAGAWGLGFDLVIHYGAYDLIGSNLDLMRSIEDGGTRVAYLLPWHPTAPAFEFARRFVREILGEAPALLDGDSGRSKVSGAAQAGRRGSGTGQPTDRLLGDRLALLYDEGATPPDPIGMPGISFFHTQGTEAELRETALRILGLVRSGGAAIGSAVPLNGSVTGSSKPSGSSGGSDAPFHLSRVAIIARSLEPYAPLLKPVLYDRFAIPFTAIGSERASLDAAADPHVMAALNLARVVLDDFERQPLLDLARSGLLVPVAGADPQGEVDEWDLLARKFRIIRGRDAWTKELFHLLKNEQIFVSPDADEQTRERSAGRREAWRISVEALAGWLEGLERDAATLRQAASWAAWADALDDLVQARLEGFTESDEQGLEPGAAALLGAVAEMRELEAVGVQFPQGSADVRSLGALRFLQASLARVRIPIGSVGGAGGGRDNGGIRVLDAMQARGLAFDAVFLIGFNADLIPRRPREDPFLGDTDWSLLRERLSRPLPVKGAGREEEHLLLAHLLGSARRQLTISWQRADDTGRARVESLALREVARVALGGADLAHLHEPDRTRRVAAHPTDAAVEMRDGIGFMPAADAGVGALLQLASPEAARRSYHRLVKSGLLEDRGNLGPGLDLLAAIESFEPGDSRYDAIVGAEAAPPRGIWSPTRLEDFGNCPQQYFFKHLLRVKEMDAVLEEHEIDLSELGLLAHRVLQDVYASLTAEGHLSKAGSGGSGAARRGIELLERKWIDHFSEVAAIIHRRFPLMWKGLSTLWKNALRTFLLHDLSDMERSGSKILAVEERIEAALPIGGGAPPLSVHGRFDRVILDAEGRHVVGDYKTMGNLAGRVEMARILKGRALQMPLYVLMKEAALAVKGSPPAVYAEVIGVGPAFSEGSPPSEPNPEGYPARELLDSDRMSRIREGLHETLRVLRDTAAAGCFPLNPDSDRCGWCPYERACRKGHEPTLTRIEGTPGAASYLSLKSKSSRRPLLSAVPGGEEGRK